MQTKEQYISDEQVEWIDDFKRSIWALWAQDGKNTWPIDLNSIIHLFIQEFFEELTSEINALESEGLSKYEISRRFKSPGRIIRLMVPLIMGMKRAKLHVSEIHAHITRMITFVQQTKAGDIFNKTGANHILIDSELEKLLNNSLEPSAHQESILIHRLCSILYAYSETIFFKTHGLVREFHGPYVSDKLEFIVRDYIDLNCSHLWKELADFEINNIRVITGYKPCGLKVDIFSNIFKDEGANTTKNLSQHRILVNGKDIEVQQIPELIKKIQGMMIVIGKRIEKMEWKDLAMKYAEIFWYSKNDLTGTDVPQKVIDNIRSGSPSERLSKIDSEQLYKMLKFSF
ncbi:MAG: hypothetical protein R8G66_22035 [Cytophagales bacterium]|nr:hypothetical protein [Cytophagales bacterium]